MARRELTEDEIRAVQEELADRAPTPLDAGRERVRTNDVTMSTNAAANQFVAELFHTVLLNMYAKYDGEVTGKVVTACYMRLQAWFEDNVHTLFEGMERDPLTADEVSRAVLN